MVLDTEKKHPLKVIIVNDFSESPIVDGVSCPKIGDNSVQSPLKKRGESR